MYGPLGDSDGLLVSDAALQQQSPRSFNFGPLCIAAAYHAAKLTPFPLALPEKTVCRAKQQNILMKSIALVGAQTLLMKWWLVMVATIGFIFHV